MHFRWRKEKKKMRLMVCITPFTARICKMSAIFLAQLKAPFNELVHCMWVDLIRFITSLKPEQDPNLSTAHYRKEMKKTSTSLFVGLGPRVYFLIR